MDRRDDRMALGPPGCLRWDEKNSGDLTAGRIVPWRTNGRGQFVNRAVQLASHVDQCGLMTAKQFGVQQSKSREQVES